MSGWMRGAGVPTLASVLGGGGAEKVRNAYGGMASADTKLSASAPQAKSARLKAGAREIQMLQEKLEEHMNEIRRLEADVKEYERLNYQEHEHESGYKAYMANRQRQIKGHHEALKATVLELGKPGMTAKMTQEEKEKLALAKNKATGYKAAEEATQARQEKAMATGVGKEEREAKWYREHGGGLVNKADALAFAQRAYDKGTPTFGKGTGGGGGGGGGGGREK